MVATRTGSNATTTGGSATAVPQEAEHAADIMAFSLPAQPLHLPDMGMPVSMVAVAVAAAGASVSMAIA